MIWKLAAAVLAVALLLVAPAAWRHAREIPPPPPPRVRLALTVPAGIELGVGDDVLDAAISADSREMVFAATQQGVSRLWRRSLDSDRPEPIVGSEGGSMAAWKATGRVVSFFAAGRLRYVALGTGAIGDLAEAPAGAGAAWLPDGSLLFVPDARGPVRRLQNGTATDVTRVRDGERGHGFPAVTPEGFTYIATLPNGRRIVRLVTNGTERDLTETDGHAQMLGGYLLHVRDGTLVAQRFDEEGETLEEPPVPLAFDLGTSERGQSFFAGSSRVVAWAAAADRQRELVWFDLAGKRLNTLGEPGDYWQVRLSPDDSRAAVTMPHPLLRTLDIFAIRVANPAQRDQVTRAVGADSDPIWDASGDRLLFRSIQRGKPNLFMRRIATSDPDDEVAFTSDLDETPSDWRAGSILFHAPGQTGLEVWTLDLARRTPAPATRQGFNKFDARWSPDRRYIAYVSDESGQPDIYVEPWPSDGRRVRASMAGGTRPEWGRDGRSLFFLRAGSLMRTSAEGEPAQLVLEGARLQDYTLAHRSDRLLAIVPRARSEASAAGMIVDWVPQVPRRPRQRF